MKANTSRGKQETVGHNNVIELNGKRYDAITGAFLGKSKAAVVPAAPSPISHKRKSVDGFVRPSASKPTSSPVHPSHHVAVKSQPNPSTHHAQKPTPAKPRHHAARPITAHQPEHAKTLMRHAVHKPKTSLKPAIKPQSPAELAAAPVSTIAPKKSVMQVDPVRMHRASHTTRHHRVQRFSKGTAQPTYVAPIAVRQPQSASFNHTVRQTTPKQSHTPDIFEAAIAHAVSHTQPTPKVARKHHKRRRVLNIMAGVGAVLILGGFFAWLNMPKIELRVASMQAGFSASIPSHVPTGYALNGPIRNQHGKVTVTFTSGDSKYHITQQASNWNSQTLLDNSVSADGDAKHEVIESNGRIIYVYENNDASWVDGGVRYDISGNAYLNTDDIVAIASSL